MKTVTVPHDGPLSGLFTDLAGFDPAMIVIGVLVGVVMSQLLRIWQSKRLFRSLISDRPRRKPTTPQHKPTMPQRKPVTPRRTPAKPLTPRAPSLGPATGKPPPATPTASQTRYSAPQTRYIEAVAKVRFRKKQLLNKGEYRLLRALETLVPKLVPQFRLMAQTSLGEIIEPIGAPETKDWKAAFHAINAKRLDFAIFDGSGYLVCAIEYQGQGHYQDAAFMRDAVKREALRLAGVPFVEIGPEFTEDELRVLIGRHLTPAPARAAG